MFKSLQTLSFATIVALFFCFDSSKSLCANKTALYTVNATVHPDVRSRGFRVSDNFYLLENFAIIHVYQANVTDLCEGMVKNFPKLEILSLINVNLSRVQPEAFQNLKRLRELSLAVNSLTEIVKGVFPPLPTLEILYLSANQIANIQEDSFAGMLNLKRVHLDRNKIVTINGNLFRNCPKIATVDFRFNEIENIGENSFDDLRPQNEDPVTIVLSRNFINNIDSNAFDLLNPVKLHLENNHIDEIAHFFYRMKEFSKIYLNKNQITCIPDDIILTMRDTAKDLIVLDNPLSCGCMDRIKAVLGEEIYGSGQFFYNSSFPCDAVKQFGIWE